MVGAAIVLVHVPQTEGAPSDARQEVVVTSKPAVMQEGTQNADLCAGKTQPGC